MHTLFLFTSPLSSLPSSLLPTQCHLKRSTSYIMIIIGLADDQLQPDCCACTAFFDRNWRGHEALRGAGGVQSAARSDPSRRVPLPQACSLLSWSYPQRPTPWRPPSPPGHTEYIFDIKFHITSFSIWCISLPEGQSKRLYSDKLNILLSLDCVTSFTCTQTCTAHLSHPR